MFFLNENIGWICGDEKVGVGDLEWDVVYKTTDGGETWELLYKQYIDGF